jgi:transcriptional regulator with XRE-family HTH domain
VVNRDEIRTAIAVGLTRARQEAGLSVAEASAEAGVSADTVRRVESSGRLRITTMQRLCDVYEVSMDALVERAPRRASDAFRRVARVMAEEAALITNDERAALRLERCSENLLAVLNGGPAAKP